LGNTDDSEHGGYQEDQRGEVMAKGIKVGVHKGDGDPAYKWNVLVLDLAFKDAMGFLDDAKYHHEVEQIQELAREMDPTHAVTQTIASIEDFFELKDKGGPLGKINVRVFFTLDKPRAAIVILGAIFKQNNGQTPFGDRKRMKRRKRKYESGDFGEPEVQNDNQRDDRNIRGDEGEETEAGS
jgi:hypothetical protein